MYCCTYLKLWTTKGVYGYFSFVLFMMIFYTSQYIVVFRFWNTIRPVIKGWNPRGPKEQALYLLIPVERFHKHLTKDFVNNSQEISWTFDKRFRKRLRRGFVKRLRFYFGVGVHPLQISLLCSFIFLTDICHGIYVMES